MATPAATPAGGAPKPFYVPAVGNSPAKVFESEEAAVKNYHAEREAGRQSIRLHIMNIIAAGDRLDELDAIQKENRANLAKDESKLQGLKEKHEKTLAKKESASTHLQRVNAALAKMQGALAKQGDKKSAPAGNPAQTTGSSKPSVYL